jgi:trans-L-3-hydroxyproline dehydratase
MTVNLNREWLPPEDWLRITTVDAHAAGEPLRVITGGFPALPGETILEKRRYARENLDHLRTALMWEPRGHADMYGCIVTEPVTPDGALGVIFMHNEGFSTMCGHGILALTKVLLDTGMLEEPGAEVEIRMDTPAGRVTAKANRRGGVVEQVSFLNVPSFVYRTDQQVDVPGIGSIKLDIAFGGAFYAFVQAQDAGVGLTTQDFRELIDKGMRIKQAVMEQVEIRHPMENDLSFLYGTIFVGQAQHAGNHSRNVCVFADGEVDRCPTGTGISGRAAIHHARGELEMSKQFVVESILGTTFSGEIVDVTTFGGYRAVVPKVSGSAYICGRNEYLFDPNDPLAAGFILC